ncbi:DUF6346 domain-containing protein [Actinoplanes utahensis]|uniref:Uncharacterized protein n=1 Tax=Actinoplanes utahensis TaxID=1869 RepID=A0A0A6UQL2_ACTUT|nr:DUF6346 domain-containing protein [Actinoplanes utahensis]KHD76674.1 hypothetical protein MB27_15395 [Actinoplanes utahensis]GIF33272.1 hypothetical protein Aut01nite_62580 [Actinoplanes utahensis]
MGDSAERKAKQRAAVEAVKAKIEAARAEIEHEQAEMEASAPDPETSVVDRRKGSTLRDVTVLALILVLSFLVMGSGFTLLRSAGRDFSASERLGWASVTACAEHGPISTKGFGYWGTCRIVIRWDDGTTDRLVNDADFSDADIGREIRIGYVGEHRYQLELAREDAPYRPWLTWIGVVVALVGGIPLFIIGVLITLALPRR